MAAKKKATFDAPVTLDPRKAFGADASSCTFVFSNRSMQIFLDLLDADGNVVGRRRVDPVTADSQEFVASVKARVLELGLAALGVTGKVDG